MCLICCQLARFALVTNFCLSGRMKFCVFWQPDFSVYTSMWSTQTTTEGFFWMSVSQWLFCKVKSRGALTIFTVVNHPQFCNGFFLFRMWSVLHMWQVTGPLKGFLSCAEVVKPQKKRTFNHYDERCLKWCRVAGFYFKVHLSSPLQTPVKLLLWGQEFGYFMCAWCCSGPLKCWVAATLFLHVLAFFF